jgi:hypothetical protein
MYKNLIWSEGYRAKIDVANNSSVSISSDLVKNYRKQYGKRYRSIKSYFVVKFRRLQREVQAYKRPFYKFKTIH